MNTWTGLFQMFKFIEAICLPYLIFIHLNKSNANIQTNYSAWYMNCYFQLPA